MSDNEKPASAGPVALCLPSDLNKPRLRRKEASQYLELVHGIVQSPASLAKKACLGGGPGFHKVNVTPLYPVTELDRWAKEVLGDLRANTSAGS